MSVDDLLSNMNEFRFNAPAHEEAITESERNFGRRFPAGYVDVLRHGNGGEGFVGDRYVVLWQVQNLKQLNADYHVKQFAPSLFLFGSDGGDEAFAFRLEEDGSVRFVSVPFIPMSEASAVDLGGSFREFKERILSFKP
jgi:hypothetical protein